MLSTLLNLPCTLIRRTESGEKDEYRNDIPGEQAIETACELQQKQRSEDDDLGETSDTRWLLILPAETDVATGDAVVIEGLVYEVIGDPWAARNPRTQQHSHVEATVRRTAGAAEDEGS